jgi:phospholipase C
VIHTNALDRIDHIVVLMLENRSFDNVAGYLYDPQNAPPFEQVPRSQPFDGVSGKRLANPIPPGVDGAWRRKVGLSRTFEPATPPAEPGESYLYVMNQLYGLGPVQPPPGREPDMSGFVRDYIRQLQENRAGLPALPPLGYDDYKPIMHAFTPATVPVFSHLARHYAICDRWFCSVPSQTWANRSFLHAGTSSGLADNAPFVNWTGNNADTIFNRLSETTEAPKATHPGRDWRVYYNPLSILPLTLLIHFKKLSPYARTHFSYLHRFYEDARNGTLPSYSFLEPRFLFNGRNDQHPPYSVTPGEELIYNVYQAVRQGKHWDRTLLIITYDEHGGTYDHVPPPRAVPPDPAAPPGQQGFHFDRYGVRVPALLISPYIEPGTVFRARNEQGEEVPLDHTSVLKTITRRWQLPGFTERDKQAADLSGVLTLRSPRTDVPDIPQPQAKHLSLMTRLRPNHLYSDMIGLLSEHLLHAKPTTKPKN